MTYLNTSFVRVETVPYGRIDQTGYLAGTKSFKPQRCVRINAKKGLKTKIDARLLPFLFVGLLVCPSASQEQLVTATARVTLVVVACPCTSSPQPSHAWALPPTNRANEEGLTLRTSSNVALILRFSDSMKMPKTDYCPQEKTVNFAVRDLKGVSKIEVIYLGS